MLFFIRKEKDMKMNDQIDIFALTDCHQEARKLCCLFSGITARAPQSGRNTLICDGGDLFKGIYDRELCVLSYLSLRQQLPEAKIVYAIGNNDFGFNHENISFLQETAARFNRANIHVLCANLINTETELNPSWVDPYILLNINNKKIMVTAFCINYIKLQKYNLRLKDIVETFVEMCPTIKHIAPDALIIINHALSNSSSALWEAAEQNGVNISLIIGGHEHDDVEPNPEERTFYPQAFSRSMWHLKMECAGDTADITSFEKISSKSEPLKACFAPLLEKFETEAGLNIPVARSTLNLSRRYADFCPLGSFVTDQMKLVAKADIALLSTGYLTHALRFEKNKILTMYNLERVLSAQTPVQTVILNPKTLKSLFNNAIRYRYLLSHGNTRFLQCSQNVTLSCIKNSEGYGEVKQITINSEPILDIDGNPLHPEDEYVCALDPFVASGEIGYDMLRALPKETLMKNNKLVRIKDLILAAVKDAEQKYPEGSEYPSAVLIDL